MGVGHCANGGFAARARAAEAGSNYGLGGAAEAASALIVGG
jgi:hypothetical protein